MRNKGRRLRTSRLTRTLTAWRMDALKKEKDKSGTVAGEQDSSIRYSRTILGLPPLLSGQGRLISSIVYYLRLYIRFNNAIHTAFDTTNVYITYQRRCILKQQFLCMITMYMPIYMLNIFITFSTLYLFAREIVKVVFCIIPICCRNL